MPAHIDDLKALDDALAAMETLTEREFLAIIAENVTADIVKADYVTGRMLEYMAARLRRIANQLA